MRSPAFRLPSWPSLQRWWPVLVGMAVLYVPTVQDLFRTIWATDQQGHGPVVLALGFWIIWRKWPTVVSLPIQPASTAGWLLAAMAAVAYALGRSQGILILEVGSAILFLCAAFLLLQGRQALRAIWFAPFFLCFMIPLPGPLVDALTQPMKMAVSMVAEQALYLVGYPISRTGVTIQIGPYQLLVADACAGLHTLFTLEAMGLLYLNVVKVSSAARNIILAILIVPISFGANVIRVIALTLITYHFGDEAGQGFLHGFAGVVLFVSALLLIMLADSALRWLVVRREGARA